MEPVNLSESIAYLIDTVKIFYSGSYQNLIFHTEVNQSSFIKIWNIDINPIKVIWEGFVDIAVEMTM